MKRVVVTGMGVISPVGNNINDFWSNITEGKCGIDFIKRFNTDDFKVKIAAEVKDFDPTLYGMDKSAIRRSDLYTQYAVAAATQAMDDSKLTSIAPERLGVYVGSGIGGMTTFVNEAEKLFASGPRKVSALFIPMMIGNIASGNIAIKYSAQGPCLPIVTACATSSHSIGEAYRSIKHGYADAIIAGGSEATVTPLAIAGFTNCMALSTENDPLNSSLPFDKRRSGFVMGEGAAVLILEEYEHAKNRGAHIYGEICGYGNTCDAYHITAPDPEAKTGARTIRQAFEEAGGSADDIIYINAHGTGTPPNDSTETKAIKLALGEDMARKALISSTKSMTGHMLGAAGAVEAIAALLALQNGLIPPTIGYSEFDPECDLDYVPNKARKSNCTLAFSTSLGFGGHNACLAFRRI